jgi:hypothetical protein
MLPTFSNLTINNLQEFSFIAGSYQELYFEVYSSVTGTPIDITGAEYKWVLSPYGQPTYTILNKTGTQDISGSSTNRFVVKLYTNDTDTLSGKFIQQPVIIPVPNYDCKMGQGVITIIPGIET